MHFERLKAPDGSRSIAQSYRQAWLAIAQPGSHWNGRERVAIAAATRSAVDCSLCAERKTALSPYAVTGEHAVQVIDAVLPQPVLDLVHRITTDQSRLSKRVLDDFVEQGFSQEQYVELLGVIVLTLSIDDFYRALGMALEPLPEALPGETSGYRLEASRLDTDTAWMSLLAADEMKGQEDDLWDYQYGPMPNVARAMTLVPNAVREFYGVKSEQYMPIHKVQDIHFNAGRTLSRTQMELVAGALSQANGCQY